MSKTIRKKRIVHINYSLLMGGAESMLVDIINEQIKHETIILIIINNVINDEMIKCIDRRVIVYKINRKPKSKSIISFIKLNYILLKVKPDVIHCHNHKVINTLLYPFRRKSFLTVHDVNIPIVNFKKYNTLFAISKTVQNDIKVRSRLNSRLIYNGIRTADIKCKKNYKLNTVFRIVQISRLEHLKKGQHLSIEALNILHKVHGYYNIKLDFIGEGQSLGYLKALVGEYNLDDSVTFCGMKDRAYIYNKLSNYELLIQPSIYEGFGLTIVEGMSAGIPVLVSNIDGPKEITNDGYYSYNFHTQNSKDMSDKIKHIYENYGCNAMKEKIHNSLVYVKKEFDVKKTVANYLIAYNN